MKRITRLFASALALGVFATSGSANAEQGSSVIGAKDLESHMVTMGGQTYRVSESTALEDEDGNPISFEELPTVAGGASDDAAAVWFETSESEAQNPVLHVLKLTGSMPR